jgi:hypothetical protein
MDRGRAGCTVRSLTVVLLAAIVLLAAPDRSTAQQASTAELTRVIGRVEVLRKGQTQWVPGVIGAHLVEGDDIRAFSGASAELTLPDSSTIVLAENSRLLLSKLEFDQKNQSRTVLVHLAIGKVRAVIAQAAIALVRARQSNFAITTPTAVAAARGTIVWMSYDGVSSYVAVEPQTGVVSRVDCLPLRGVRPGQALKATAIFAGSMATDCGTPVQVQQNFLTFTNKATENAPNLSAANVAPPLPPLVVLQLITTGAAPGAAPVSFGVGQPVPALVSPSTTGRDVFQNEQEGQTQQTNVQPLSGS